MPVMSELSEEPSVAAGAQARRGEGGEVRAVRGRFIPAWAVASSAAQHLERTGKVLHEGGS